MNDEVKTEEQSSSEAQTENEAKEAPAETTEGEPLGAGAETPPEAATAAVEGAGNNERDALAGALEIPADFVPPPVPEPHEVSPTVLHQVAANGAAQTVAMMPPESGAANPQTVASFSGALVPTKTYFGEVGQETEVELHHVVGLLSHGWIIARDDIEGGLKRALLEFQKLHDEIASLPAWMHALTLEELRAKIDSWFKV